MRTCGSCKHWDTKDHDALKEMDVGVCGRVPHMERNPWPEDGLAYIDDPGEPPRYGDEPAHVVDGSDYFAALRTKENFGCVLWEAKDGRPPEEP